MSHPLDRAVFNALTTRLSRFATPDSGAAAVRLDPEVGVFLAAADDSAASREAMGVLARRYPGAGLVEHEDGRLEILEWAKMRSWSAVDRTIRLPEPAHEPELLPTPAAA